MGKLIPIAIRTLEAILKGLVNLLEEMEIRGRVETIEKERLFRAARILRRVLETWEGSCHLNSSEEPSHKLSEE